MPPHTHIVNGESGLCIFCGLPGHFISECLVCQAYIVDGKVKKNAEGKIVLPSGSFVPRTIPGRFIKNRVDEWYKRNPRSDPPSLMMYEISTSSTQPTVAPPAVSTVSTNMSSSTFALTADQRIAALEQEIYALRSGKKLFDGIEITHPHQCTKVAGPSTAPAPTPSPKVIEILKLKDTSLSNPIPTMLPSSQIDTMPSSTQPPVHPF